MITFAEKKKGMNLFTAVDIPAGLPVWNHTHTLMLLGSCFTTHMGNRLSAAKFQSDTNPYGVLYNPLSIAVALQQILEGKRYQASDLFFHGGCWHSAWHHGDFSSSTTEETLLRINTRLERASAASERLDGLLLTFGTAWVYENKDTGQIVGNCHKLPERCFHRRMLSVDEIVAVYDTLLDAWWKKRPGLKVLFTVSPIRHIRDGLHANQLSKATLLLAVEVLQRRYPQQVSYFPAYEMLVDELRDYRFYAADMVHPSEVAVDWVWERWSQAVFSSETRDVIKACDEIRKMIDHKPFHPQSEEYKRFLGQIVLKIERLNKKYPYLDFEKEIEICHTRLNI